jgi:hypothetical protein
MIRDAEFLQSPVFDKFGEVSDNPVLRELRHYYREADISVLIRTSTVTSL